MYNRYIPQADGSYQRKRMQDTHPAPNPQRQGTTHPEEPQEEKKNDCASVKSPHPQEKEVKSCETPCGENPSQPPAKHSQEQHKQNPTAFSFLRNLLPGDFDTGDLLIVLLLLLMAGDCEDGQGTALLTLALYLFM